MKALFHDTPKINIFACTPTPHQSVKHFPLNLGLGILLGHTHHSERWQCLHSLAGSIWWEPAGSNGVPCMSGSTANWWNASGISTRAPTLAHATSIHHMCLAKALTVWKWSRLNWGLRTCGCADASRAWLSYRNTAMGQSCGSHYWTLILKNKVIPATTPSTPVWPSCTYTVGWKNPAKWPKSGGFSGRTQ